MTPRLTGRQRDIAIRLAQGYTPAQIGRDLNIHNTTVFTHTRAILDAVVPFDQRKGRTSSRLVAVWAARNLEELEQAS